MGRHTYYSSDNPEFEIAKKHGETYNYCDLCTEHGEDRGEKYIRIDFGDNIGWICSSCVEEIIKQWNLHQNNR